MTPEPAFGASHLGERPAAGGNVIARFGAPPSAQPQSAAQEGADTGVPVTSVTSAPRDVGFRSPRRGASLSAAANRHSRSGRQGRRPGQREGDSKRRWWWRAIYGSSSLTATVRHEKPRPSALGTTGLRRHSRLSRRGIDRHGRVLDPWPDLERCRVPGAAVPRSQLSFVCDPGQNPRRRQCPRRHRMEGGGHGSARHQ
jgi:hypothetical protein